MHIQNYRNLKIMIRRTTFALANIWRSRFQCVIIVIYNNKEKPTTVFSTTTKKMEKNTQTPQRSTCVSLNVELEIWSQNA